MPRATDPWYQVDPAKQCPVSCVAPDGTVWMCQMPPGHGGLHGEDANLYPRWDDDGDNFELTRQCRSAHLGQRCLRRDDHPAQEAHYSRIPTGILQWMDEKKPVMRIQERLKGAQQCPSEMAVGEGGGWTCCQLEPDHAGPHASSVGWRAQWAPRWAEPLYPGRCPSVHLNERCMRALYGHEGWMHRDQRGTLWGEPVVIPEAGTVRTPRSRSERKGKRR